MISILDLSGAPTGVETRAVPPYNTFFFCLLVVQPLLELQVQVKREEDHQQRVLIAATLLVCVSFVVEAAKSEHQWSWSVLMIGWSPRDLLIPRVLPIVLCQKAEESNSRLREGARRYTQILKPAEVLSKVLLRRYVSDLLNRLVTTCNLQRRLEHTVPAGRREQVARIAWRVVWSKKTGLTNDAIWMTTECNSIIECHHMCLFMILVINRYRLSSITLQRRPKGLRKGHWNTAEEIIMFVFKRNRERFRSLGDFRPGGLAQETFYFRA